ncbi:MAG: hypothetical protein MUE67_07400 [Anaerolineales bacterium]|jgi:hypothetical protein|nr:hypothetical protein [Anaerolineales bacterium]
MSNQSNPESAEPKLPRKPYVKPKIEQVSLVLEEAVLGTGCKIETLDGMGECYTAPFTPAQLLGS